MPERWLFLGLAGCYVVHMVWYAWRYDSVRSWLKMLFADPLLYIGASFCVLLGVQLWNSGRELVFNRDIWEWEYGSPPHSGWPSAINQVEAQQWLFVALMIVCLVLALRSLRFSTHHYRVMCRILLANAILLFFFGVAQYVSGTHKQYWFHPLRGNFFSVFGYPNHAASYFVLMFGVGFGFLMESVRKSISRRKWELGRLVFYGGGSVCCAMGAVLSFSRAGILFVAGEILIGLIYFIVIIVRRLPVTQRVNISLLMGALMVLFVAVIYQLGHDSIRQELTKAYKEISITRLKNPPPKSLTGIRYPFWVAAYKIWQDYTWTGCGSWGFRYLKKLYIPRDEWITKTGYANVHFDGLQFLAEYGLVGFGLLLTATCILFWKAFGWPFWLNAFYLFSFMGICVVLCHSVIDLPFRCPAVSSHWLCLLTILGCIRKDKS